MPLLNDADDVQLGSQQVDQIYLGENSVWTPFVFATGGTVATEEIGGENYRIHTFTSSGTFEVVRAPAGATVEYLVIGGGGGGGGTTDTEPGGGGGAGGYRSSVVGELSGRNSTAESAFPVSPGSYAVVVGAGGSSQAAGEQSSFDSIVALGGGNGGRGRDSGGASGGGTGGSGGGRGSNEVDSGAGGLGTAGQGFDGGGTTSITAESSGSGGGAGGAGVSGTNVSGQIRPGGAGLSSSITGTAVTRATGADSYSTGIVAGGANTGDGGRGRLGFSSSFDPGSPGGSGVVIVRYRVK